VAFGSEQTWPQAPQFAGSSSSWVSQPSAGLPSQSAKPLTQGPSAQAPADVQVPAAFG
jgi:hypothetical protein